ncbi:hypothetical protein PybrP1_006199 [[Pythium] brassicae (nom. inval.)]|nr:hypothetical protein PybrP1_006199 [[Pythium] brassicae (nom. inval.)]
MSGSRTVKRVHMRVCWRRLAHKVLLLPSHQIRSAGDDDDDMMDVRTHAWPSAAGAAGDDDVKMLLADLDDDVDVDVGLEADGSAIVMMTLQPSGPGGAMAAASATFSEEEQQRELCGDAQESPDFNDHNDFDEELWTAAAQGESFDLIDADQEPLALAPPFSEVAAGAGASAAVGSDAKKRRGRKPSAKPKAAPKKATRPPPSPSKARLRNYERRSRTKRENTMLTMKDAVSSLEAQIAVFCKRQPRAAGKQQTVRDLALEAIRLSHQNYHLRRAIDDHRFFHSMVGLEFEHREATPLQQIEAMAPPSSWRPLTEASCYGFIRESYQEIAAFASSADFVSSGLEICGWREKRKLCGTSVKFQFHKTFAKDCSEELATRSWEMRAVQDQVSRYFGPFLDVQVEVIQRLAPDVVVVRRKITHTQDGWVHHTIYLLFRAKTPDGHLVCIRDMNPEDTREGLSAFVGAATAAPASRLVIWSNCFIWWKFTTLPKAEATATPTAADVDADASASPATTTGGFEVEYGGSLSSATSADAAFWMREVLLCALRWENLVIGPLLTL